VSEAFAKASPLSAIKEGHRRVEEQFPTVSNTILGSVNAYLEKHHPELAPGTDFPVGWLRWERRSRKPW
jgi:hypothetical protein